MKGKPPIKIMVGDEPPVYEEVETAADIVICRPIRSKTLLDQIFGRGLRGKEFKGTEDCDIVVPNDRFEFSDGTTRQFVSFAVPEDDIGRMLGTKVEEVPESEED